MSTDTRQTQPLSPTQPQSKEQNRLARAIRAAQARQQSGRRRLIDPTTCEREYTPDQLEFMNAMQQYKQRSCRQFPTWCEVLEVLQGLGYTKIGPTELA